MKEIYEMKGAGRSIWGIAQELYVSHNTVRRYLNSLRPCGPSRGLRGIAAGPLCRAYRPADGRGIGELPGADGGRLRYLARRPGGGHRRSTGVDGRAGPFALGQLGHLDGRDGGPGSSRHSMPARVPRRLPPSHERPRCDGCRHSSRPSLTIMPARRHLLGLRPGPGLGFVHRVAQLEAEGRHPVIRRLWHTKLLSAMTGRISLHPHTLGPPVALHLAHRNSF